MSLVIRKRTRLYVSLGMVFLTSLISMGPAYAGGSVTLTSADIPVGTFTAENSADAPSGYTVASVESLSPAIATVSNISGIGTAKAKFYVNGVGADQSPAEIRATFTSTAPGEDPDSASAFETVVKVVSITHKENIKNNNIGDLLTKKDFKITTLPTGYQNQDYVKLVPSPLQIVIGENKYKVVCGSSVAENSFRAAEVTLTKNWVLSQANDTLESSFLIQGADGTWKISKEGSNGSNVRSGPLVNGETHYESDIMHTHEYSIASNALNNHSIEISPLPLYGLASIPKNGKLQNCVWLEILKNILSITVKIGTEIVKGKTLETAKWENQGFETSPNYHDFVIRANKNKKFWTPNVVDGQSESSLPRSSYACFIDNAYNHTINASHKVETQCTVPYVEFDDGNKKFIRNIIRYAVTCHSDSGMLCHSISW